MPSDTDPPASLAFGEFVLDLHAQRLLRAGAPVALPPRYLAVLQHLARSGGRLVGKEELLDAVWGATSGSDSALKVAVHAVREALGEDPKQPRYLETVPRRGYRFIGQPVAAAPCPAPGLPPPLAGNLPPSAGGLIGRAGDLLHLQALLRTVRCITLVGPGGVGKTRLALAAAAHAAPADGVWLLRLDALQDPSALVPAVARLLSPGPGADAGVAHLARALAPLQVRLLLDNAEHLHTAVLELAQALLDTAPGVQLLVTSQVALGCAGERTVVVAPLDLPQASEHPMQSPAVQLLVQRAQQLGATADPLDAAQWEHAAAISRCLEGLPLALELAAARVPLLGWAGVRDRLQADAAVALNLLTRGAAAAPERQRSLRATVAWAVGLLEPPERQALEDLTVWAGAFSVEGALAVIDSPDALDILDTLRQRCLLQRLGQRPGDDARPRWRLYDSVRAHAAQALQASGRHAQALGRCLAHLTALYEQADDELVSTPLLPWLAHLHPDNDNLRAALQQAHAVPALQAQAQALFAASACYRARAGWRLDLQRDLAALPLHAPQLLGPVQRARLQLARGVIASFAQLLPPREALAEVMAAVAAFATAGETLLQWRALVCASQLLMRLQAPVHERAEVLDRARSLEPAHWGLFQSRQRRFQHLGWLRDAGRLEEFEATCKDLLVQSQAQGDLDFAWGTSQALAQVMFAQGRAQEALQVLEPAVQQMREEGVLRENAHVLAQWAGMRVIEQGSPEAVQALHEAAQMLYAQGRLWWAADLLPWVPAQQGRVDDAVRVQDWADALVQARGDQRGPLFGPVRQRFEAWRAGQAEPAAAKRGPAPLDLLDDAGVMHRVFGAAQSTAPARGFRTPRSG